jgi:hypothetical protein
MPWCIALFLTKSNPERDGNARTVKNHLAQHEERIQTAAFGETHAAFRGLDAFAPIAHDASQYGSRLPTFDLTP